MVDEKDKFGIPQPIAQACGVFAGATMGWKAGEKIGALASPHLSPDLQGHSELIAHGLGAFGAFGCAYASSMLARSHPDKAPMIAAGVLITQFGSGLAAHGAQMEPAALAVAPLEPLPHAADESNAFAEDTSVGASRTASDDVTRDESGYREVDASNLSA